MKISGKDLVWAIDFLKENVVDVRFMMEGGRGWYTNTIPTVEKWNAGDIVLVSNNAKSPIIVAKILNELGIKANIVSTNGQPDSAVKFTAKAGDDIIYILSMVMEQQKQQQKLSHAEWVISGLTQNVDMLIEQLPHVKRGMFSHGVKAFKQQVEVLKNLRNIQNNQSR